MGGGRPDPEPGGERRARSQPLTFRADPLDVVSALEVADVVAGGATVAPGGLPSHRIRLLRPSDLAVFDVLGYDVELRKDDDGAALVPTAADAHLIVRFAFQHLGERAYFQAGTPDAPQDGDEAADAPPIEALAAQASRLVFDVPAGERIEYSIEGVLAAMSRLPLRVAPLATPAAGEVLGGSAGLAGAVQELVALPGGLLLARTASGALALTTTELVERSGGGTPVDVPADERASVRATIAAATAVRTARTLLVNESAVDLTERSIARTETRRGAGPGTRPESAAGRGNGASAGRFGGALGDLVVKPDARVPNGISRPRAPRPDETAIEAPFRLILSPSVRGGFVHSLMPFAAPADLERVELWHTRLGVRRVRASDGTVRIDESRDPQRVVRAIWARDKQGLAANVDPPEGESPFRMSLNSVDRATLVRQSADPALAPPLPVGIDRLYLSSLGAFLFAHGRWEDTSAYAASPLDLKTIRSWDHEAMMGRDQYVSVVYPGYLFPFGHRCTMVKITERKIYGQANPKAILYQRKFLVVGQPTRAYTSREMPFRQVTLRPLVTPNIMDPSLGGPNAPGGDNLFWPAVDSIKFRFTLDCLDHDGKRVRFETPLLFVAEQLPTAEWTAAEIRAEYTGDTDSHIAGLGQTLAFAPATIPGDTAFELQRLRFDGIPGPKGSATSSPMLIDANIIIPAMRHLAPEAPISTVKYAETFKASGFAANNADAQLFLELTTTAGISFAGGTDRSGGFVQPDLPIAGLSRVLGTVGEIDDIVSASPAAKFNPEKYLAGALPKLFGLFALTDIMGAMGLDKAPKFITEQLDRVAALLADLAALRDVVTRGTARLGSDATNAPTAILKAQAEAARARLETARAALEARVAEVNTKVAELLALETSSSPTDVITALEGALGAIGAQVTALRALVREQPLPPPVKAELERLLNALEPVLAATKLLETLNAIAAFVNGIDPAGLSLRARYDWRPTLTNFPKGTSGDDALFRVRPDGLLLSVEARASGTDGVGVDVLAELREFSLNLFPGAPLMRLGFDRLAFRAASGRKPEVDAVFKGIEFVGVLGFIETLKELIPLDAFSDPPYVDVSPSGVTAGFSLALPSTAIGVFSLENISLGADARVPFLGNEALTIGFNFCTREKPFRLTVMMIGGGGFVGIRLSPRGLVLLEMALEAGASLSIDLGVASGSVSVMVGVYLRLEADAGSLTGYFRIRGEVDVMGLITASITMELALRYEFDTGKMVGRASLVVEIDVLLFSGSVTVTCERRLAGSNGDPTLEQVMGVLPDGTSPAWSQYCAAFAQE